MSWILTSARPFSSSRLEIEPILGQYEHERAKARDMRTKDWEWERYLSCSHVPHPKDRIAVSDYMALLLERSDTKLSEALEACEVRR
jgi:hypothetical protein